MATAESAVQRQLETYRETWRVAGGSLEEVEAALFVGLGSFAMVEESAQAWRRRIVRDAFPYDAADERRHLAEYRLWRDVAREPLAAAQAFPSLAELASRVASAAATVERTLAHWVSPEPCLAIGLRTIHPSPEAAAALMQLSAGARSEPPRAVEGPRMPEMTADEFLAMQRRPTR